MRNFLIRLFASPLLNWSCLLLAAFLAIPSGNALASDNPIKFNEQIRPILSKHCIACHGPDEEDRQADVRLDTFEGATADLGGYAAIVAGDADASEIIARILSDDEDMRMPPADHAKPLPADEVALLKQWINEGAEYQGHWSFTVPEKPAVPEVPAELLDAVTVHNAIDSFILERVAEAGLTPNKAAEPAVIVRRISLTLTGLPPIAHDKALQTLFDAYIAEPTQDRLAPMVDGLMETTAYAEHWAAVWLDLARYADTVGYSGDEVRDIWPWRDWLIRSLKANKSYKEMSVEMLAGDLLPNATDEQRLATAFHRNTLINNEGGTDDEEFRTIAVKDRLSTTLNAWMGITVRCAECHSHKYDPISHQEYYQLLDFFNQTVDSDKRDERPKIAVIPELDPAIEAKYEKQIEELQAKLATEPRAWTVREPVAMASKSGTTFELLEDQSILATGPNPNIEEYAFTFELPAGTVMRALRLEALPHLKYDGNVGRSPEGAFILSQIRIETEESEGKKTPLKFADAANDFNQPGHHANTAIREEVESGASQQGWAVNHPIHGYKRAHEAVFELDEPLVAEKATKFTVYLRHDPPWPRLNMGCMRISTSEIPETAEKYREGEIEPVRRQLAQVLEEHDTAVRVPVMQDLPTEKQRQTHIMLRGNFRSPGEEVQAKFPEAFANTESDSHKSRLDMARWIFAEDNPLTARVAVNRYWSRVMGSGLVETEEDFGTQGSPPSHPELLDYLAVEFVEQGWDVKKLLKKLVMSATFQQSGVATEKENEVDPRNRLLARGPRFRLTAEVVRDQALAVSGLLSKKAFGPPVYPPSPVKRITNAFTGGTTWVVSDGEDRYRRALYTFLKRSSPHPLFETFDMSSRDVCSFRRLRTNTPLQSFMTLNDITFVEAARTLAKKMIASTDQKNLSDEEALAEQIAFGLQTALYVEGSDAQKQVLGELYAQSQEEYQGDLLAAAELTGRETEGWDPSKLSYKQQAELVHHAALTVVGNVILNLDGFLNN